MHVLSAVGRYVRRHHWGLIATFIALGGTAYAATEIKRNSIKTKHIAKGAVAANKLKKDAVRSSKVKNRSLKAIDFAPGQLPEGPPGPAGSPDTPQQVLDKILQVDGSGSGLDADRVDGVEADQLLRGVSGSLKLSDSPGDAFNTNADIFNVNGARVAGMCIENRNGTGEYSAWVYIYPPSGASVTIARSDGQTFNVPAAPGTGVPVAATTVTGGANSVRGGWFTMYIPNQDRFLSGFASAEVNDTNSGETCTFAANAQVGGAP